MFSHSGPSWRIDGYGLAVAFIVLTAALAMDTPLSLMALEAPPSLERVARFVTDFGLSGYMFFLSAATAATALWLRERTEVRIRRVQLAIIAERAIFFFAALGVSGLLAQLIKHVVGRTRPSMIREVGAFHFEPFSFHNVHASFPSGHTTSAFSAAVALSLIAPAARWLWFTAAVLIGVSRVVVRAHFPTDVLAGAVLGTCSALWVARWFLIRGIAFEPGRRALRLRTTAPRSAS